MVIPTGLAGLDSIVESGNPLFVTYGATKATLNAVVAKYSVGECQGTKKVIEKIGIDKCDHFLSHWDNKQWV